MVIVKPRRARGRRSSATPIAVAVVAVLLLGLVVVVAAPTPAAADIAGISPSSTEVDPGGSAAATVTVRAGGFTCVNAQPSDNRVATPTFSTPCDDEPEWRTTMFVQAPADPGTYTIRVTDQQSGEGTGRTFTLRVRAPAPPPTTTTAPPPTSTTTAPLGTLPPTTTTTSTTTSTTAPAVTTTTSPGSTTTTVAPFEGDPFTPLSALVDEPVPAEGLFLPLLGDGYRDCLPLTKACSDPGSGLVLIPARTTELTWGPIPDGATPAPRTDLRGIAPMAAVGVGPADPRAQNYAITFLDLTAPGGQLRTLVRGIDENGRLGTVSAELPLARPTVSGPSIDVGTTTSLAAMPFGRPSIRTASSFSEAAPAVPMFASVEPQPIYALRPDNAWGLNLDLIPLFGGGVPFLVRGIEGPPGLFIVRPANLRVPQADEPAEAATPAPEDAGGGTPAVAMLGAAVLVGAVATATIAILRRRRTTA